jgi:hypothetical protein
MTTFAPDCYYIFFGAKFPNFIFEPIKGNALYGGWNERTGD